MNTTQTQLILNNLNEQQQKAVESIYGETLVIAGAGSGKTAVLTRRCAFLIVSGALPGSILSLTFTNKAAAEMNHRMRTLLKEIGIDLPFVPSWANDYSQAPLFCTFHSLGVRLLREFGDRIELRPQFNILDSDDQTKMMREILKEMNVDSKQLTPSYALYFVSQCKQELLTPSESSQLDRDFLPTFHNAYARYWNRCRTQNVVDFDDLIFLPYLILRDNQEILEICHKRWKHIQIDEFQDTNTAQFQLIYLLYPPE